jgi:hypothetical protein
MENLLLSMIANEHNSKQPRKNRSLPPISSCCRCSSYRWALLGGLRIGAESHAFVFVAPPLVTLLLAVLLIDAVRAGPAGGV